MDIFYNDEVKVLVKKLKSHAEKLHREETEEDNWGDGGDEQAKEKEERQPSKEFTQISKLSSFCADLIDKKLDLFFSSY